MRAVILGVLAGCSGPASLTVPSTTSKEDADTDTDTDSDADTDTASAPACPFGGEWEIGRVWWEWSDDPPHPIDVTGTATATGVADECTLVFDALADGCAFVETVYLEHLFDDQWSAWSDGANYIPCRYDGYGARDLGAVTLTPEDGGWLLFVPQDAEGWLLLVGWTFDQYVELRPGAR